MQYWNIFVPWCIFKNLTQTYCCILIVNVEYTLVDLISPHASRRAHYILCGLLTLYELIIPCQSSGAISPRVQIHCWKGKVCILISWLLVKPADLGLHCLNWNQISTFYVNNFSPYIIIHGWKFKISKILNLKNSILKTCSIYANKMLTRLNDRLSLFKTNCKLIRQAITTLPYSELGGWFPIEISLKILNLGKNSENFTHIS